MLGEENADRFFTGNARGEPHQFDALARRHARSRLIHQEKFWSIGECYGELQPLEIAIGEFAAGAFGVTAHADQFKQMTSLRLREPRRRSPEIEQLAFA